MSFDLLVLFVSVCLVFVRLCGVSFSDRWLFSCLLLLRFCVVFVSCRISFLFRSFRLCLLIVFRFVFVSLLFRSGVFFAPCLFRFVVSLCVFFSLRVRSFPFSV